ncbi:hypothetical protein ACFX2K_020545 [Malus domestica]
MRNVQINPDFGFGFRRPVVFPHVNVIQIQRLPHNPNRVHELKPQVLFGDVVIDDEAAGFLYGKDQNVAVFDSDGCSDVGTCEGVDDVGPGVRDLDAVDGVRDQSRDLQDQVVGRRQVVEVVL